MDFDYLESKIKNIDTLKVNGKVTHVIGLLIESLGPSARIGELCYIYPRGSKEPIYSEIVGFKDNKVLLMPFSEVHDIAPGCEVRATGHTLRVGVGKALLGRVLDGMGRPMDGKGPVKFEKYYSVYNEPPNPLLRSRIKDKLELGVKSLDGVLTVGSGQRIGIFAGSGVGKSTLLGMIARNTEADINVFALVGERGREVREFIERDLGEEGLKKSVVVVATSDTPALIRLKGAYVATSIAEYFRDQGKKVILMMDSVTRFAMAQREVGLTIGEPPATRGYTPSVFSVLPKLLERSGTSEKGSITGIYTVLVEGSDMDEPVADAVRGILDGHVVLRRELVMQNHYPAIDILESVSRLMPEVCSEKHLMSANRLRSVYSTYKEAEDLINIGGYVKGSNPHIDFSIKKIDEIKNFLKQGVYEKFSFDETVEMLLDIFKT
ncbi:MAG: flagellar protein export ATPase FliI [Candidatus Muirbacterium halophilum]|nr:flagellar protein export ATPase FliI [Candidatus Muirbacterium halophilum]MCK9474343.1 flagellar protein export ATPase FliI [Candidatus Muirbacterium halophilum]